MLDLRTNWNLIRALYATARRDEGQTMAEYGVVLALITLAVIGVFTTLGTQIGSKITDVTHALGG
jgi:pilus assembly protein Flp/PilA